MVRCLLRVHRASIYVNIETVSVIQIPSFFITNMRDKCVEIQTKCEKEIVLHTVMGNEIISYVMSCICSLPLSSRTRPLHLGQHCVFPCFTRAAHP
jgi:hypothetical protein